MVRFMPMEWLFLWICFPGPATGKRGGSGAGKAVGCRVGTPWMRLRAAGGLGDGCRPKAYWEPSWRGWPALLAGCGGAGWRVRRRPGRGKGLPAGAYGRAVSRSWRGGLRWIGAGRLVDPGKPPPRRAAVISAVLRCGPQAAVRAELRSAGYVGIVVAGAEKVADCGIHRQTICPSIDLGRAQATSLWHQLSK
jgi:hypothetical protein